MYTNIPGLAADSYSWCSTSGQLAHCERSSDCDLQIQKTWISGVNHEFEEVPVGVAHGRSWPRQSIVAANKIHPLTENGPSFISRTVTGSRLDRLSHLMSAI